MLDYLQIESILFQDQPRVNLCIWGKLSNQDLPTLLFWFLKNFVYCRGDVSLMGPDEEATLFDGDELELLDFLEIGEQETK